MTTMICPNSDFKVGDRVRVLGRTVDCPHQGIEFSLKTCGVSVGDISNIKKIEHGGCEYCDVDLYYIESCPQCFHPQDLEHIGGEDMAEPRYKATGKKLYLKDIAQKATREEFDSFLKNYFNLLYEHSAKDVASGIEVYTHDKFMKYATTKAMRTDCFVKWLIEKGYIEEVQSEYDRWVDEMPHALVNAGDHAMPDYIEWAKRMPRQGE